MSRMTSLRPATAVAVLIALSSMAAQPVEACKGTHGCKSNADCNITVVQSRGLYTPFGYFPKPPYKVWGNAEPESVPAARRVGVVSDCAAYEEYYGTPARLSRNQVRRLRNDTWALHQEYRQARRDIRDAYGIDDSPIMAGLRTSPSDATAPYAPSGPRAYANTPDYHGPLYTGSFQVDGPAAWPRESGRRLTAPGAFTPRDANNRVDTIARPDASPDIK